MNPRRKNPIARLPKAARDVINRMLADGATLEQIRQQLGEGTEGVGEPELRDWKKGGHRAWLKQQERLEDMRAKREFALELAREGQGVEFQEAGWQLAANQIYELLMGFDQKTLKTRLKGSPEHYGRLLNALFRLGDSGLKYERYRAEVAERKARIQAELARAGEGGISAETRQWIEEQLRLL
jgi:hypothetical protein